MQSLNRSATNGHPVPIQQQKLLANIRDTSLELQPDKEADAMTETTNDDPVRDAFQFLNTADESEDEFEVDEIVYMM